jgi:hypothetical protein
MNPKEFFENLETLQIFKVEFYIILYILAPKVYDYSLAKYYIQLLFEIPIKSFALFVITLIFHSQTFQDFIIL